MSGIYIPGMEMPEDEAVGLFLYPDGTVHVWRKTSAVGQEYDAIAVPEHGRLIDADDFFRTFPELIPYEFSAPTIIPADKEAKE